MALVKRFDIDTAPVERVQTPVHRATLGKFSLAVLARPDCCESAFFMLPDSGFQPISLSGTPLPNERQRSGRVDHD